MVGSKCFSLGPPKVFFSKWRKNWKEKFDIIFGQKCPCTIAHGLHPHVFLHSFFFSFPECYLPPPLLLLPFIFYFFFWFTGQACPVFIFFFSSFAFFFWFRCDLFIYLFYGHDFYFLINLGDWFFFFLVFYHFFVLIGLHFLTRVYA